MCCFNYERKNTNREYVDAFLKFEVCGPLCVTQAYSMLLLSARVRHQTYPVITGQDEAEALRAITTVSRHGAGISVGVAVLHLNDSGHSLPAFEIRKRMFRFVNGLFYYFSICFRDCGR